MDEIERVWRWFRPQVRREQERTLVQLEESAKTAQAKADELQTSQFKMEELLSEERKALHQAQGEVGES